MRNPLHRIYGIETEYGILVEGKDTGDLMEQSRLLVRAYAGPWAGPWDYRSEDPRRDVPFEALSAGLMPFFVTRAIFAGAGKVGVETNGPLARECFYQLSQRADFVTEEASVDTLHRRPILNTRDEPHAQAREYRRLHVICGDANMSEFATALKVGTTSLVLRLLEAGWRPLFRVRQPVDAIKKVSRDPSL